MTTQLHLPGLPPDLPTVDTPDLKLTRLMLRDAVRCHSPMLLTGPVGIGKTFAVHTALTDAGHDYVTYKADSLPRGRTLSQELLTLLGMPWSKRDTAADLRRLLIARCTTPTIVLVDEAQNLGVEALRTLRNVSDHHDTNVTLLLVGYNELAKNLRKREPALEDRLARRHQFRGLEDDTLIDVLAAYHPMFANTPPATLHTINRTFGTAKRGSWRRWARVLEIALAYADTDNDADRITPTLLDVIESLL